MSTKSLEDKLQKLSSRYIYQEVLSSYLLLLLSTAEDAAKQRNELGREVNHEILEIKQEIRGYIIQIEKMLNSDDETRLQAMDACTKLKSALLQKYEGIYGYFLLWNVLATAIGDEMVMRQYKEDAVKNEGLQWELFLRDCTDYLHLSESPQEEQSYISQLLQCIPVKMGRDKYFDTIRRSLTIAFAEESEDFIVASIRAFDGFCAPELEGDYGKFFPEIAKWLVEKKTLLPSKLTDEALELEYEEFQETYQALMEIEDYFSSIYNDINTLILLFSQSYTFEELTEGDISYRDLYYAVVESINGEVHGTEKEAMLDAAADALSAAVEPVIDNVNALRQQKNDLMEKITDLASLSEDSQKILLTEDFVRNCYYGELNDELFHFGIPSDLPPANESYKNRVFDDFLERIRSYFGNLSLPFRRIAMGRLLSALPQAITASEVITMMQEALDTASNIEGKLLILDKAGTLFQENDFYGTFNQHEEMEYHHDHHCDCEHDHHHHH